MDSEKIKKKQTFSLNIDKTMKKSNERLKEYKIEETIAEGTFGKVKLGIHKKTNEKVK
jgi:serine/threonine protein kinase